MSCLSLGHELSLPPSTLLSQSLQVLSSVPSAVVPLLHSPSKLVTYSEPKSYSQNDQEPELDFSFKTSKVGTEINSHANCEAGGNPTRRLRGEVGNEVSCEPKIVVPNCVTVKGPGCDVNNKEEFVSSGKISCVMANEDLGKSISGGESVHRVVASTQNKVGGQQQSSREDIRMQSKWSTDDDKVNPKVGCEPDCGTVTSTGCGMAKETDSKLALESNSDLAFESQRKVVLESDSKAVQQPSTELAFDPNSQITLQSNGEMVQNPISKLVPESDVDITLNPNGEVAPEANIESSLELKSEVANDSHLDELSKLRMDLKGKQEIVCDIGVCEETSKPVRMDNGGNCSLKSSLEGRSDSIQLTKSPFLTVNIPAAPSTSPPSSSPVKLESE